MDEYIKRSLELYCSGYLDKIVEYNVDELRRSFIGKLRDGSFIELLYTEGTTYWFPPLPWDEELSRKYFGERLKYRMWTFGMRQSELARLTGIPQSRISDYICGKRCPDVFKADKIARALRCRPDYFIFHFEEGQIFERD